MRTSSFFPLSISALLFSLAGCSGNTDTSATGGAGGTTTQTGGTTTQTGGSGGATSSAGDVTVSVKDVHETPSGTFENPPDPATISLSAVVQNADGTFETLPADPSGDGLFVIKGVPAGAFYLHYGARTYLYTTARTHDLGRRFVSRPDAQAATSATPMVFFVTGLSPWGDLDTLEVFTAGSGAWGDANDPQQTIQPDWMNLSGYTVDTLSLFIPNLVDGTKGDTLFLTQTITRTSGGVLYNSLGRAFVPPSFTQKDGEFLELSGAFTVPPEKQITLDLRRTEFAAFESTVNPAATAEDFFIAAYAEPGGKVLSTSNGVPTIISYSDTDLSDSPITLTYGDAFPATWGVYTGLYVNYRVSLTPPGQQQPRTLSASAMVSDDIDALPGAPIVPLLSPPQGLTLNGMDAYGVLTAVGATPEIAWTAPSKGAPDIYRVTVRRLNSAPPAVTIANLFTDQTHLTLPPDLLVPGEAYYIRVAAFTGYDKAKPFRFKLAEAYAEALTGPFAP